MARVYVALDLETTGLDPETDQIIEVGAIRFRGPRILEEFQSFVRPNRAIPYQIQQLTGITDQEVADAPPFPAVKARLSRFVGDHPIVGHNVNFDLQFLNNQGLFHHNEAIDTFEIASILLPHADRYSLKELGKLLGIEDPATHRALDDARVTYQLFEALLDQARSLNSEIIKDVADMASRSNWSLAPIFKDLSRERSGIMSNALGHQLATLDRVYYEDEYVPPLKPVIPPKPLDEDALAALLEDGGVFDQNFDHFEHRPEQVMMLRSIVQALNHSFHLLVEAGTGTGKSMAYLIPAIYWATQNEQRVVISTNTINLQDQILTKDLPDLKQLLNLDFRATALKGRSNYVCGWRVDQFRNRPNLSQSELRLLAKIAIWLPNTLTGDRQELFMPTFAEQALWSQVCANGDICPPDRCARENCFFARSRQAAETAHVIVVNHALLLADVAVNNRAIPDYRYLIIDEAHHLEESVTTQLSFSANKKSIEQLLGELSQPGSSLFSEMERQIQQAGLGAAVSEIGGIARASRKAIGQANQAWYTLFNALEGFLNQFSRGNRNEYDRKLRITNQLRTQPAWSNVELAWDNANTGLAEVIQLVIKAGKLWDGLDSYDVENWDEVMATLAGYRAQLEEIKEQVKLILGEEDRQTITWIEQKIQTEDIILHAAPLHVGDLVYKHLFAAKESVTLTSATLQTANSFEYIKERLNAWEAEELSVGSPFDYQNSTLVYIPTDIPEPNASNFQKAFDRALVALAEATQGRVLVLFTSYSHLRQTANNIRQQLADRDIVLHQQGQGVGRRQLLDNFKGAERAVLMGTKSFWEGVDIPGQALSCVVIAKLPFAVPSDPIYQARSETFDDSFSQYSIPEAILHFRQGFGRLIRTRSDRGVVVLMDKRVVSKGYGQAFLDSLPEVTVRRGTIDDLPQTAAEWINED